jgi:hypothetical protein
MIYFIISYFIIKKIYNNIDIINDFEWPDYMGSYVYD